MSLSARVASFAACLLLALACNPSLTRASGFSFSEQSATAAGTGGAGVARTADPGLAWYNPAALADGGGLRAGLNLVLAAPLLRAQARDGSFTTDSDSGISPVPALHASYATGQFVVGLAVGVPFGSTLRWPADWPGRRESLLSSLAVLRTAPFVGGRLGPLRLALGMHLDAGRMRFERNLDFIDQDGEALIDMDGVGFGVDASAFVAVSDALGVGLVYRGRGALALSGSAHFETPRALSARAPDQAATAHFTLPDQLLIGSRLQLSAFALLADLELTFWSVYDRLFVDLSYGATPDIDEPAHWSTTATARAGGEWAASEDVVLRGGLYFDPTPVPDATFSAAVPDLSRTGVTLGASFALSRAVQLDAFYEFASFAARTANAPDVIAATYHGVSHFLGAGVRIATGSAASH